MAPDVRGEASWPADRTVAITINGRLQQITVTDATTLLNALRWGAGLTGTKECCAAGECGACSVLLDGKLVNSCLILAAEADGGRVTTIEGLAQHGELSRLQQAFLSAGAVQCGFCIPGMVMAAHALLQQCPHPSREEIQDGLAGNLCRCAGYEQIIEAVEAAAKGHNDD